MYNEYLLYDVLDPGIRNNSIFTLVRDINCIKMCYNVIKIKSVLYETYPECTKNTVKQIAIYMFRNNSVTNAQEVQQVTVQ